MKIAKFFNLLIVVALLPLASLAQTRPIPNSSSHAPEARVRFTKGQP